MKLVSFAGSTREGSFNQAVADCVADGAEAAGAEVIRVNLAEFEMPLFNQDLEAREGLPENVKRLKEVFLGADGFLIASPEYNSAFTPLMKNTIDWCSRAESDDEEPLAAYAGKSVLLVSASPGPMGGIRGLYALRSVFQNIGVTVFPEMRAVRSAYKVIAEGRVADESEREKLTGLAHEFVAFAKKLAG